MQGRVPQPALRVVRGTPTPEELVAVVAAVLAARAPEPPAPAPSYWRDPAGRLGVLRRGPLAWSASARPR